jgi:glucokinase
VSPTSPASRTGGPVSRRPDPVGLGFDVGGTKILGLAVSSSAEIVAEERRDTPRRGGDLLEALAGLAMELNDLVDSDVHQVVGVGIGVPGLVDTGGVLRYAPNLLGASGTAVRVGMETLLDRRWPVAVDNDATCAMAGEHAFGAAVGVDDALLVTVGTGIGGGIVSGGHLVRGAHNFAGEIGHLIVDPHGPPCPCGKRGCWERYASGSGLGRLARDAAGAGLAECVVDLAGGDPEAIRGEHVVAAAVRGDSQAEAILGEFARWIGLGLANLANVLDPQLIMLGGGLVNAGQLLLEPIRAAFGEFVEGSEERSDVRIVLAALGDRGGAVGAGVTGLEVAGLGMAAYG